MGFQKYKFISSNDSNDELWKKELRFILNRDIHEKSLGCCVRDTHVKVGDVHLGTFYEAQFLFGNAHWISMFSQALKKQIQSNVELNEKKILLIGYETYIEPVLIQTVHALSGACEIDFAIYEEPRYILNNQKSEIRFRTGTEVNLSNYDQYVIICGIASTLSTFNQISNALSNLVTDEKRKNLQESLSYYTIIQVLPDSIKEDSNNLYSIDEECKVNLHYNVHNSTIERIENEHVVVLSRYLIEVFCEWEKAYDCKWCFDPKYERPLIGTNESSVIPVQMIGMKNDSHEEKNTSTQNDRINLFEKKNGKFVYSNFLYYNHIERDNHHYQYYIRTNALLKYIISDEEENKKLTNFCDRIKGSLFQEEKRSNRIDVLIVPIHYSNERFLNVISKRVFDNSVEIINFDPHKEFRSNFETKYSNYSYIIEAAKSKKSTQVFFHYLDDQIITGATYHRVKSFVSSLIKRFSKNVKSDSDPDNDILNNIHVFASIITLIDRNSQSSRLNYIDNDSKFFSLIDIAIPSLRNHADSCYLCAKSKNAEIIKENSALISMSNFWYEKETYHCVKTLKRVKDLQLELDEDIKERKFRQFYCENLLWEFFRNNWNSESEMYTNLVEIIKVEIAKHKRITEQYEYLISFIKVVSKPLLFYRENFKKVVLSSLNYLINLLNVSSDFTPKFLVQTLSQLNCSDKESSYSKISNLKFISNDLCEGAYEEKYYLYLILLSNLCNIESSYLVNYENIIKSLDYYNNLCKKDSALDKKRTQYFSYICAFIKKVTSGTSGLYKALYLDKQLDKNSKNIEKENIDLIEKIYLENLESEDSAKCTKEKCSLNKGLQNQPSLRKKYLRILGEIAPGKQVCLIAKFAKRETGFMIAATGNMQLKKEFDEETSCLHDENCINITEQYTYVSCYNSDEKIDSTENIVKHIYLVIKNPKETKKNEINFENLKFIRSILKYRYILTSELTSDIQSGAIRELFDDDVFLDILTQPKTISHGESEDIKKHLASIENKYSLYEKHGEKLEAKYYDIANDLTLFSNLLISFFHSLKVSNDLGKKHQFEEVLKLTPLNFILKPKDKNESHSYESNEIDFEAKSEIDFSCSNMNEDFTKRFTLYKKCLSYNRKIEISGDDFEKIDGLINLSLLDENSYWISIAFVHILIRNAEHHGDPDSVIEVFFEKNNKSYDLVVKNKKSLEKLNFKEGITIKALKYIFGNSSRFNLVFPNSENNDFIAKIENFIIIDN